MQSVLKILNDHLQTMKWIDVACSQLRGKINDLHQATQPSRNFP
jgi:hypothetical protein